MSRKTRNWSQIVYPLIHVLHWCKHLRNDSQNKPNSPTHSPLPYTPTPHVQPHSPPYSPPPPIQVTPLGRIITDMLPKIDNKRILIT
jgi:hypothetical protein